MAEIALSAALTAIGNAALNIMGNAVQNIIGNFAEEERNRLYGLSGDIDWIQGKMRQIQAYLKDADSKPVRGQEMTAMIENIRDLCYDMEDVLETFLPQMESYNSPATAAEIFFRRSIWKFSYSSTAHNFAMEIAKIRTRIEDIDRPITSYDITAGGAERSIWDPRRPRLYADEPDIVGFNRDIQVLKARLVDESEIKLNFVSIVGMPGLGKTTLAKNLFRSTRDQFQCSALVYVSQQPNVTEITEDIARQVGLEVEKWEDNLEAKLANLTEHLREKRYVIMFDDIWDSQTWDALKISIPMNSKNGSRIILTSRNSGVGRYIGGESSLHELQPLDPGSSWQLFCKMVMGPVENATDTPCLPSELEDIGRKIVERCGGVPLAIVVTVGLLRERERREHSWSEVLKSMGSYRDFKTRGSFGLSYNDLPIELKPCFLYFGLFPEDYEVFAFQLINIWVAEKFIKVERSGQTLEEVGEAYLNNLVARNLIQVASRERDGRIRSCRIHDLLRELCIDMAEESNFFATIKLISTSPTRVRRVSNACPEVISGVIERAHQTPKLRSFLCFDRYDFLSMKQLKNLCRSCRFIRVLSVTIGAGKCSSASLPNEIGNLIHLSYLEIWTRYYVSLRFPNTISNLKSLLTLNLQRCYAIVSLPACFWKLKQLRHILLPQVGPHDVSLSERIWKQLHRSLALKNFDEISLPNLQTLTACTDGVLKAKGFSKVTSLQKLGIDYCNEFDLSLCQNLSKMQLRYQSGYPNTNKFPPNLTELTLIWTKLSEDSMETLGKLSNLKILILGMNFYAGDRIVCSRADFPQLQVLQFSYLSDLEELIVEEGGMPCLLELIINHCKKLKVLPDRFQNMIVYCHPSTYEEYMKLYPQFSDDE